MNFSMSALSPREHDRVQPDPNDVQTAAPTSKTLRLLRIIETMQAMEIEYFFGNGGEQTDINFATVSARQSGLSKVNFKF